MKFESCASPPLQPARPLAPAPPPFASVASRSPPLILLAGRKFGRGVGCCGRSGLVCLPPPPLRVARCSRQALGVAGVRVCSHSFGQPSPSGFVLAVAPSVGGKSCGRSPAVSSALSRLSAPPSSPLQPAPALSRPPLRSGLAVSPAPPSSHQTPCPSIRLNPPAGAVTSPLLSLRGGGASVQGRAGFRFGLAQLLKYCICKSNS